MLILDGPRTLRLRARGQITLPQDLRRDLELEEDSSLSVIKVGKALLLTPAPSRRAALARSFQAAMAEEGLSLRDLLDELRLQREGGGGRGKSS
jgi:bifunctional DNA-binding transcriptional regulator/antitoxin component of YhaV-PrlF toxin-antitoxin module